MKKRKKKNLNLRRAIAVGVFLWLLIFLWWSIIMFTPSLSNLTNLQQYLIHFVLLVPAGIFSAWLYYKCDKNLKTNGFTVGFIVVLTGTILDLAITVPFFIKDYALFYGNALLWGGFAELIFIFGLYEILAKKKKKN